VTRTGLRGLAVFLAALTLAATATAQAARERADLTIAEARASMQIDPAAARLKARRAERESDGIVDPTTRGTVRATALWLEGEAAYRLKDFAGARPKLDEALALVRKHAPGSKLEGELLISNGSVDSDTGRVVDALREFQRAYAIFLRLKDARQQAIALICIGSMYNDAKDYQAALKYFDQALASIDGDPGLSISIQNNRASTLRNSGRYPEAERGFRAALSIAETMRSKVLAVQIMRNIARLQLKQGDLADANRTVARGLALAKDTDDFNQQAMLAVAAQAALDRGDIRKGAELIGRSFAGVNLSATSFSFRDAHATAYHLFHALGQDALAYQHLLAVKRLDDQTTELATSTGAALMTARFDFANQELRIARLKADDLERGIAAARQRARVQRWIFYGGAATTAIVIGTLLYGLVVTRRSRDQVRAANDDLALANVALGKALAAKTEFLATTSHEIRTPLNGILGMTQVMLADATLPEATRDRLTVVQAAGTTMRTLVDDILDVAKMENGKLVLENAPFDLQATITDATRLWDTQAGAKGIVFRRELDSCPIAVAGDPSRVRQVVFNLLSNALKFTDAGEIVISASRLDDGQVAISVRDSGVGIPADKLEAIFESFRQADAGTTRRFGGTGLGLAICRQLARAMGGDVSVESRVGEGSVFTVTLPLATPTPADAAAMLEVEAPALLIVERNPIARSLLRTLLAPHAERILFANGTEQALAALRDEPVSRVLADGATLAGEGDALAALASIVVAKGGATVCALWQPSDESDTAALLATGVDCMLAKPVTGPLLVTTLFGEQNDPLVRRAA
jgi:signal transduction histidine kinase